MIRLICILFLASATSVAAAESYFPKTATQYECEPLSGVVSQDPTIFGKSEERTFEKTEIYTQYLRFIESKEESFVVTVGKSNNSILNNTIFVTPKIYASKDGRVHKFYRANFMSNYLITIRSATDLKSASTFKLRSVYEGEVGYTVENYECTARN